MIFEDHETFRVLTGKPRSEGIGSGKPQSRRTAPQLALQGQGWKRRLFLRALDERAKRLPELLRPHMGNHMARSKVERTADLMTRRLWRTRTLNRLPRFSRRAKRCRSK